MVCARIHYVYFERFKKIRFVFVSIFRAMLLTSIKSLQCDDLPGERPDALWADNVWRIFF